MDYDEALQEKQEELLNQVLYYGFFTVPNREPIDLGVLVSELEDSELDKLWIYLSFTLTGSATNVAQKQIHSDVKTALLRAVKPYAEKLLIKDKHEAHFDWAASQQ